MSLWTQFSVVDDCNFNKTYSGPCMLEIRKTGHGDDLCNMLLKDWLGRVLCITSEAAFPLET
jgi:hypothetical protein